MSWRERNANANWSAFPSRWARRPAITAGTTSKIVLSKSSWGPAALGAFRLASSTDVSVMVNRGSLMSAIAPGL